MSETRETADEGVTDFTPPPYRARIFTLLMVGMFCGQMGLSIISPFFPAEAAEKNVTTSTLGWIFSIFEVATMLGAPVTMRLLVMLGPKSLLVAGNDLGGLSNILLGFCWYAHGDLLFVISCFLLRILAGFAFALASTTSYSLVPALFGPAVSSATGQMEGVNGVALIMGPILGSSLFSLGGGEQHLGYVLPFVALGVVELLFAMVNSTMLPALPLPPQKQPSLTRFSWKVVLPFTNCVVTGINLGLLNPTLQPHLAAAPLHYSVQVVGFVFAAACAAYALAAPLAGVLDDYTEGRWAVQIMAFGAFVSSVGYAFLGPASFKIGGKELVLTAAGCWGGIILIGVGVGFQLIPVYKQILQYAMHENSEERYSATSAVFTIAFSMGSFLGPTLGGVLSQAVGIQSAYTYSCVSLFGLALFMLILSITPAFQSQGNGTVREPSLLGVEVATDTDEMMQPGTSGLPEVIRYMRNRCNTVGFDLASGD